MIKNKYLKGLMKLEIKHIVTLILRLIYLNKIAYSQIKFRPKDILQIMLIKKLIIILLKVKGQIENLILVTKIYILTNI